MRERLGIRRALTIAAEVKETLSGWRQEFKRWAVPPKDYERLSSGIENRLEKS
jgi:hypothetical protein